jgi:O-antigen/teichoic acid export membrane protein
MESLAAADKDLSARPEQTPFVRNLLWMIWSGAVSIANSIILWIFIARMRDVEELGRFTIVMGLYALFYSICSMGLIPFFVNEISRRKESSDNNDSSPEAEGPVTNFIGSAAVFLSCSSFICAALMTACGFLVSQSWSVRISTLVLSIAMIPTGIINLGESVAISYGKTRLIAFVSTLENILRTLIPFALIWLEFDIAVICASFVAVRLVAVIPYLWTAFRNFSSFAFDRTDFSKILKAAPTFGGTIILASINWQAPIILLGFLSTEAESAKFGVASRFLIPVSILMASYASVLQPIITGYVQKSTANAGAYLTKMAIKQPPASI